MRKNFYKRGVAPLVPLIVSAVVLVSAMAASFFYQQSPQTTGSKAIVPAPTGGTNIHTCSSSGGSCSAFCLNPVDGPADALCPDSLGLTYVCCRNAAATPTRTRTPTQGACSLSSTLSSGQCSDACSPIAQTHFCEFICNINGESRYKCVPRPTGPTATRTRTPSPGVVTATRTRTPTPSACTTANTLSSGECSDACSPIAQTHFCDLICTLNGQSRYRCVPRPVQATATRTRTPTQGGAVATRTRTPTPDNCPATCTGNSQCSGCGVGFSCNLLINRCVSTTVATPTRTRTPTGGSAIATRTPTPGTTCSNACSAFTDAGCEAGNCGPSQMLQTRTCSIGGCSLSRCISSSCNVNPTLTRTPTPGVATSTNTPTPGGATATSTRTPTPCPAGGACAATNTPTRTPTSSACGVSVSLTAIPSTSTTSSLANVDLRASVTAGSGTIIYRFYCLASDATYTRQVSTTTNPFTAVDLCNYSGGGIKTAKVIVTSATCNATAQTTITLNGLATPTRTRTPTIGGTTTNPTRTRTPTTGGGTTNPTRTRTPTSGGATPTRTRTPTPFGNPTNTPIPPPTDGPTPTSSPNAASLMFAVNIPDVTASNIDLSNVQVDLFEGTNLVESARVSLAKVGDLFQTEIPVVFNNAQNTSYDVAVKTSISIKRTFINVNLVQGQTLDCINASDQACGELIAQQDKQLFSGDSDGFDTASGSYNKVDSADLQVMSLQFNSQPSGSGPSADFNLDGNVDISDLEIIGKNYGTQGD